METLTSFTNTATRAIWGENGSKQEEPRSGVSGDVTKGEPYDAGNMEHVERHDEADLDGHSDNYKLSKADKAGDPSQARDSSLVTGDSTELQNDTRDPANPRTNPENQDTQAKENVDDTAGTDENENPVKIDGPGPQPIAELAKQYDGDAGNAPSSDSVDKKSGDDMGSKKQSPEEEDGPQTVSHGEGTGEKYVKSTGLKADGGDFDAAAPGAGREADRLLEEKGFHREENGMSGTSTDSVDSKGSGSSGKTKTSLKDKIKAKLHKS